MKTLHLALTGSVTMTCPYLADAIHRDVRPRGPSDANVCFAHDAGSWDYAAADLPTQEALCATDRFQACPRLKRAVASDRPYPAWVKDQGFGARPWWRRWG